MTEELKPCPFCGAPASDMIDNGGDFESHTIGCSFCFYDGFNDKDWNIRPLEDTLRAEVAELKEAARWMPISEGKPKFSWGYVLVTVQTNPNILPICGEVLWHDGIFDCVNAEYITHYRLLPLPADTLP
jgi:hypothetical protein